MRAGFKTSADSTHRSDESELNVVHLNVGIKGSRSDAAAANYYDTVTNSARARVYVMMTSLHLFVSMHIRMLLTRTSEAKHVPPQSFQVRS